MAVLADKARMDNAAGMLIEGRVDGRRLVLVSLSSWGLADVEDWLTGDDGIVFGVGVESSDDGWDGFGSLSLD